jgi:WD40 repeat protein
LRIERFGTVGMRLAESGPTLCWLPAGGEPGGAGWLVAVSERPFAQRALQVFELFPPDAAEPAEGAASEPFPTSIRHLGPRIGAFAVGDDEVWAVLADEPSQVVRMGLPDLAVRERRDAGGPVTAIAASPGAFPRAGDRLVVGLATGEIVRLDPAPVGGVGGRAVVARSSAPPTAMAFAPSGDRVAVGTESGVVEIVWVTEVRVLTTLAGGRGAVGRVLFTPDGARVVASTPTAIHLWSVKSGAPIKPFLARMAVEIAGLTASGLLVTNQAQEEIVALDPATGRAAWRLAANGPCTVEGDRVFSARFEQLREVDGRTGEILGVTDAPQMVDAVVAVPGREVVVVALATGSDLRVVDLATGDWSGGVGGHETDVVAVQFVGGDRFVTGGRDSRACVWQSGRPRPVVTAIGATAFGSDPCGAVHLTQPSEGEPGQLLAAFGERVARCGLDDGAIEADSELLGAPVSLVHPVPGTELVLACTEPRQRRYGSLVLLDAGSLQVVHTERIDRKYRRLRIRADGCVRLDGALGWGVFDVARRGFVERGVIPSRDPSREHHRSADDGLLVEVANRPRPGGSGKRGLIWVTELPAQWTLIGGLETEELSGRADLSRSGRYLATPHVDGRVRVWDLEHGECMVEWDVGAPLAAVWFFPDDWRVLGSTTEGELLLISEG